MPCRLPLSSLLVLLAACATGSKELATRSTLPESSAPEDSLQELSNPHAVALATPALPAFAAPAPLAPPAALDTETAPVVRESDFVPAPSHDPEPHAFDAPLPMFGALLVQRVRDYALWRAAFDEQRPARVQSGFVAQGIMRGLDNDKLVAVWLAVTDVDKARAHFADRSLRDRLKSAGADGKAQVVLWSNVEARMDPGRQGLSAALVTARVRDLPVFKTAFDAAARLRMEAGIVGYGLSRDVDDETIAYIYLQSDQPAKLKAYIAAKETKQSWKDAGLTAIPSVTYLREGDLTTYQ